MAIYSCLQHAHTHNNKTYTLHTHSHTSVNTCIHTRHTYVRTYKNPCVHTHSHMHTRRICTHCTHKSMRTNIACIHTNPCIHTVYAHTFPCGYSNICTYTRTNAYAQGMYIRKCMHAYTHGICTHTQSLHIHTHTHSCVHTHKSMHTHTCTHTHTHTDPCFFSPRYQEIQYDPYLSPQARSSNVSASNNGAHNTGWQTYTN